MKKAMGSKKGFSLLELIIIMTLLGTLATTVVVATKGSSEASQVSSALQSIGSVQTAAMQWYADNNNSFTNVSVTQLVSSKLLGDSFTGTSANPWGGNFSLAVNGADSSKADLTLTNVTTTAAPKITSALTKKGLTGTYTAASKTYVITL